jgi:hypothetical protein
MNKVKNCKTFIHRFDSDPRLQIFSTSHVAHTTVEGRGASKHNRAARSQAPRYKRSADDLLCDLAIFRNLRIARCTLCKSKNRMPK